MTRNILILLLLAPKESPGQNRKMNTAEDLNDDVNYINGLFNGFGMEEFPFKAIFESSEVMNGPNKFMMLDNKARVCSLLIQLLHSKQVCYLNYNLVYLAFLERGNFQKRFRGSQYEIDGRHSQS